MGENGISKSTVQRIEAKPMPGTAVVAAYAEAIDRGFEEMFHPPPKKGDLPSIDAMLQKAPKDMRKRAVDIVEALLRKTA